MLVNPLLNTRKVIKISALSMALALTACGGGGNGNTVDTIKPIPDRNPDSNDKDSDKDALNSIVISEIRVYDANNNATRTITSQGAMAKVSVTDEQGNGISSALVTFEGLGVVFGTSNGAVLTNTDGEAAILVRPKDLSDTGSYQLTATAIVKDNIVKSDAYNVAIQPANIIINDFKAEKPIIESGETTNLTLVTVDANSNFKQNNTTVNFATTCGTFSDSSVASTNQGNITTTYKAIGEDGILCEGIQTITATPINNTSATKTVTVTIERVEANALLYTSNESIKLGTVNSGTSISSMLEFTVYANGVPAANKDVIISKVQAPADFSFYKRRNHMPQTVKSNSEGKVVMPIYPGALPGPVELKATLKSNPNIFALSKNVSVATGRPVQDGISLSFTKNVLVKGIDGDTANVTVRLVDRVGNPVPDDTVVSFVSEGGSIDPNCNTTNGACSVEFRTQNPRPLDSRVTILAYVEGEKSYIDIDGNNMYTSGTDKFSVNIGSFFRDDNENNKYDADKGEFIYRRGQSAQACGSSLFTYPNISNTCSNELEATLRYQAILGLADDKPVFDGMSNSVRANIIGTDQSTPKQLHFNMYGNSAKTVSMPSGTGIAVNTTDKTEDNDATCEAELVEGYLTVPNNVNLGRGQVLASEVKYTITYNNCAPNDYMDIIVNTPVPSSTKSTKRVYFNKG